MILAVATSSRKSLVAQAMILRQLISLVKALHDMHQADGDAQRAAELVSVAQTQLAEVSARLPDPDTMLTPGNSDPRGPRDPDPRDPRDAEVEVDDIEIEVEDHSDEAARDDDLPPEARDETPEPGQDHDPTLDDAGGDTEPLASPLPGKLERDEKAEEALATATQGQVQWEARDPSEVSNDAAANDVHTKDKSNDRDDDGRG